jgi:hypothetical protein
MDQSWKKNNQGRKSKAEQNVMRDSREEDIENNPAFSGRHL